MLKLILVAAL